MITWFDMPANGLSNGGQFEIKELSVTENGEYETPGEMYNKVTVNVEGGGTSYTTLYDGSVTTFQPEGAPFCSGQIFAHPSGTDSIKVTFNGTEYTVPKVTVEGNYGYGEVGQTGPDFTEFPFFIQADGDTACTVLTPTAGTYTLKIEEPQSGGSSDFSTAEVTFNSRPVDDYEVAVPWCDDPSGLGLRVEIYALDEPFM